MVLSRGKKQDFDASFILFCRVRRVSHEVNCGLCTRTGLLKQRRIVSEGSRGSGSKFGVGGQPFGAAAVPSSHTIRRRCGVRQLANSLRPKQSRYTSRYERGIQPVVHKFVGTCTAPKLNLEMDGGLAGWTGASNRMNEQ